MGHIHNRCHTKPERVALVYTEVEAMCHEAIFHCWPGELNVNTADLYSRSPLQRGTVCVRVCLVLLFGSTCLSVFVQ